MKKTIGNRKEKTSARIQFLIFFDFPVSFPVKVVASMKIVCGKKK